MRIHVSDDSGLLRSRIASYSFLASGRHWWRGARKRPCAAVGLVVNLEFLERHHGRRACCDHGQVGRCGLAPARADVFADRPQGRLLRPQPRDDSLHRHGFNLFDRHPSASTDAVDADDKVIKHARHLFLQFRRDRRRGAGGEAVLGFGSFTTIASS